MLPGKKWENDGHLIASLQHMLKVAQGAAAEGVRTSQLDDVATDLLYVLQEYVGKAHHPYALRARSLSRFEEDNRRDPFPRKPRVEE